MPENLKIDKKIFAPIAKSNEKTLFGNLISLVLDGTSFLFALIATKYYNEISHIESYRCKINQILSSLSTFELKEIVFSVNRIKITCTYVHNYI